MGWGADRPDARRRGRPVTAFGLAGLIAALPVAAQQGAEDLPGPDLGLTVSTGLVVSDNRERERDPEGTSTVATTGFDLVYDTRTRNERFTARAGATLEFDSRDDANTSGDTLQSPFLTLAYQRQSKRADLSLNARYSETDVGFAREEDEDGTELIVDQGTRTSTSLAASLTLGRDAPVTYDAALRYAERSYTDTTDPDLTDQRSFGIDQGLSLALNPTTRLTFDLAYRERDEDDAEDTLERNTTARIGLTTEARSGLQAAIRFGYSVEEITRTRNGARDTTRQDAPVLAFSAVQPRPNGTISADLTRRLDEQGSRTTLRFGRDLELPVGRLSGDLGVTIGENDETLRLVGSLDYVRPLRRGDLSLRLSQQVTSNADSDFLRTSAALGYRHELTPLSQVALNLDLSASDALDADETDRQQMRLRVTYSRSLTEDWQFNVGLRHLTARESGLDPIVENAVFANVSRRFDILP